MTPDPSPLTTADVEKMLRIAEACVPLKSGEDYRWPDLCRSWLALAKENETLTKLSSEKADLALNALREIASLQNDRDILTADLHRLRKDLIR